MASISHILRQFEATQANVDKMRDVLVQIARLLPREISFEPNEAYEDKQREFADLLAALPAIDGWKPTSHPVDLDRVGQIRLDSAQADEPELLIVLDQEMAQPTKELAEYRYRLRRKRRDILRSVVAERVEAIDRLLEELRPLIPKDPDKLGAKVDPGRWQQLHDGFAELGTLLGSAVDGIGQWSTLLRHLGFGEYVDLADIADKDWPAIRPALERAFLDQTDPVPVAVTELSDLAVAAPSGPVPSRLAWEVLTDEAFERLVFALLATESTYENVQWLTKTRAPDRGRDLSAVRRHRDGLSGAIEERVIVQCKHWRDRSINVGDVGRLRDQMKLWEPPRVDVLVIATSGQFTADAVDLIEKHNRGDTALRITMWPGSHLELLLAKRPGLISQFGLRREPSGAGR